MSPGYWWRFGLGRRVLHLVRWDETGAASACGAPILRGTADSAVGLLEPSARDALAAAAPEQRRIACGRCVSRANTGK